MLAISHTSDKITAKHDVQYGGSYVCKLITGQGDIGLVYKELLDYIDTNRLLVRGDAIELLLLNEEIANNSVARLRELQIAIQPIE